MANKKVTNKRIAQINHSLLEGIGGISTKPSSFARIRNWGDKNHAVTHDGIEVERREYIYIDGYGLVRTLPTTMHFIYEDTSHKIGRWTYMCTCGSIAGIVSYKELPGLISPELGEYVLACNFGLTNKQHTGIFRHADGSSE